MLEFVIAVVVAFIVGLLIGVTAAVNKVKDLETLLVKERRMLDEHIDLVYTDISWQINLLRSTVCWQDAAISNSQRKRLRRLGSQLLRIKDKDEDHPDSVEGQ